MNKMKMIGFLRIIENVNRAFKKDDLEAAERYLWLAHAFAEKHGLPEEIKNGLMLDIANLNSDEENEVIMIRNDKGRVVIRDKE